MSQSTPDQGKASKSSASTVAGFYEADSELYDARRWRSAGGRRNYSSQMSLVAGLLPDERLSYVEVGCGTGRFSSLLAERASTLVLVDVAPAMLTRALARAPGAIGLVGDAVNLPLSDASADAVVCLNVLNHVKEFQRALQEFARVLRPGGFLVTNFNNLRSPYVAAGLIVNSRKRSFRADVFSHWTPWGRFTDALSVSGFRVVEAYGHLPIPGFLPAPAAFVLSRIDKALRGLPGYAPAPVLKAQRAA